MEPLRIEGCKLVGLFVAGWLCASCSDIGNRPTSPSTPESASFESTTGKPPQTSIVDGLTSEARAVLESYRSSNSDTASSERAQAYLASFPSNTEEFISVFDPPDFDNLYQDSHLYIEWFERCTFHNPELGGHKLVNISKDLLEGADAISYIKHATVRFAVAWPTIFSNEIHGLSSEEVDRLVAFLANVEDHGDYSEYQKMIDALRHEKDDRLCHLLEQARSKRMSEENH